MERTINSFDLSLEVIGVSKMLTALSIQLDNTNTDTLTNSAMRDVLYGISNHLDRIASDLEAMNECSYEVKEGAA